MNHIETKAHYLNDFLYAPVFCYSAENLPRVSQFCGSKGDTATIKWTEDEKI